MTAPVEAIAHDIASDKVAMGLVGSSYFLCSRKVMLSSETYQSYVSSVAPSKHAFLLPLTIRSFLERTRSLYDTLITDAGNINTSSPCETPNSVMILGGYNDSAEACAIIDFLRKSDEGNNILSGKMAASSQTRPFDDETPKIHVMSFLNENVEGGRPHPFYASATVHSFFSMYQQQQRQEQTQSAPTDQDETDEDDEPTTPGSPKWAQNLEDDIEKALRESARDQETGPTIMEQPSVNELISQTRLFIFGNSFCHFIRKRSNGYSRGSTHGPIVQFLKLLFQSAPEGSMFVFVDLPSTSEGPESLEVAKHVRKAADTCPAMILSHSMIRHQQDMAPNTPHQSDFLVAVKPCTYILGESFYFTASLLRFSTLSSGDNNSDGSVLSFDMLRRSSRFSEDAVEHDKRVAKHHFDILQLFSDISRVYKGFQKGEDALKRLILLGFTSEQLRQSE